MAPVRSTRQRRTRRREDGGQAVVEFVLTLNVLMLLIVVVWQFGLAFSNFIDVSNAARAAARKGANYGATSSFVQTTQDNAFAQAAEAAYDSAGCTYPCTGAKPMGMNVSLIACPDTGSCLNGYIAGNNLKATVQAPFNISILGLSLYSGQLTSSTTMRIEKSGS
jgi:Flp pilus assembly protein TadG